MRSISFSLLLICLFKSTQLSQSLSIAVNYTAIPDDSNNKTFHYMAQVSSDLNITERGQYISKITGNHVAGYSNDNVEDFTCSKKITYYIPKGLHIHFKNLIGLIIAYSGLREVRQVDLKVFVNLKLLDLSLNNLTFLEKDLFKFNEKLKFVDLSNNQIKRIHPTVFKELYQFEYLMLNGNECTYRGAMNHEDVLVLIPELEKDCSEDNEKTTTKELAVSTEAPQKDDRNIIWNILIILTGFVVLLDVTLILIVIIGKKKVQNNVDENSDVVMLVPN